MKLGTLNCSFALFALVIMSGCGGGGGGGDEVTCGEDKPLLCSRVEGCCPRGGPYFCDGLCYAVPVGPCAESDICTFNVKNLTLDPDEGNFTPRDASSEGVPASSPE